MGGTASNELPVRLVSDNSTAENERNTLGIRLLNPLNPSTAQTQLAALLHVAIVQENVSLVFNLVRQRAVDVNARTSGLTPLMLSACQTKVEIVSLLLMRTDLDINARTADERDLSALMLAIFGGNHQNLAARAAIVGVIASDSRCVIQQKNKNGVSALEVAASVGNSLAAKRLVCDGRILRYDLDDLFSHCQLAVHKGHKEVFDVIMEFMTTNQKTVLFERIERMQSASEGQARLLHILGQSGDLPSNGSETVVDEVTNGASADQNV